MKNLIIVIALCIPALCSAQLNKNIWKAAGLQLVSGAVEASRDVYLFHYSGSIFERIGIPKNEEAWKNKYKKNPDGSLVLPLTPKYFLSTTLLVGFTDLFHSTKTINRALDYSTTLVYAFGSKRKRWFWYVADFSIMFASRSLGFTLSYDVLFK
jgi:hypothetical protein